MRVLTVVTLSALLLAPDRPAVANNEAFETRIDAELESKNPAAATLYRAANDAWDAGDLAEAEQLYQKVRNLQPEFAHATRRQCYVVSQQGRRDEALALCREALAMAPSSPWNQLTLLQTILATGEAEEVSYLELEDANNLAWQLIEQEEIEGEYLFAVARSAHATKDASLLERVVSRLLEEQPDEPYSYFYAWLVAMSRGQFAEAEHLLELAREAGMQEEFYYELMAETQDAKPMYRKILGPSFRVGAFWAAGLAILLVTGMVFSRIVMKAAERMPGKTTGESSGLSGGLRSAYRVVLWISCVYYYVSLPLMIVAVVAMGAGAIYLFVLIGRIPVKITLIIVCVVAVTVWATVKSLFVRRHEEDPGDRLDLRQNPRLDSLLNEVAGVIGTRPVDNVYLTPGTEIAVMERGGIGRQIKGSAERCLILGVGALDGMKIGPFKAILAHEYGHFLNKDTAGGGFALAVRRSLSATAQGLAEGGAAVWYNPAWWFLNGFNMVFLRISQGASRLQEVLADRWAAFAYGAGQFECGLRHVIERQIRFEHRISAAFQESGDDRSDLMNLYIYQPRAPIDEAEVAERVEEAVEADPSPYDSHPKPADRFRWTRSLGVQTTGDLRDAQSDVWSLIVNRDSLEQHMTEQVRLYVATAEAYAEQAVAEV